MKRMAEHAIDLDGLDVVKRFSIIPGPDLVGAFLAGHPREEAIRRLGQIDAWLRSTNVHNVTGVRITPAIVERLASQDDLESVIAELEGLRTKTLEGDFDSGNPVQKDLEFNRFASIDARLNDGVIATTEQYQRFLELSELPSPQREEYTLDPEQLREVERAAFEAYGLLVFLKGLRANTDRGIVVVGNHRYGRHWVVEPIEHHLRDGFAVRYDRVPSHHSWALTVPHQLERQIISGFPPEFVKELSEAMPHVVLVDVSGPGRTEGVTKFTRALRDYVNWFITFNDIRSGGVSRHETESTLPRHHFPEIRDWYEYDIVRRKLAEWVKPGPTYRVAHWAPELKETIRLGDLTVPSRRVDLASKMALAVLANPGIYRTEGDDLPEALRGTRTYYFNDPEKQVAENIVLGFGPHGLASRVEGTTTDEYVAIVQRHIRVEVDRLVAAQAPVLAEAADDSGAVR